MRSKQAGRKQSNKKHYNRTWVDDKKRFGTLPYDKLVAPTPGIFDAPTRCFVINEEWSAIVMGMVSLLAEIRMWKGATDESFPAIREILKFLSGENCDMFNCDDVEDCLETSPIADAIAAVGFVQMEAGTQAHIDDLLAAYDGTAQSVGSSIPATAPNLNSLDDNALCSALSRTVAIYAAEKTIKLKEEKGVTRFFQQMVDLMREVFGTVPAWLAFLLGDNIYGCVANVFVAINVLSERVDADEVACCLHDELRSAPMTLVNWDAALTSCAASLPFGAAQAIACLMDGDNNLSIYVSFLELYNELILRQIEGADFPCLCAPDGWFWQLVQWSWSEPTHSGMRTSPVFTHTNPANGELHSIVAMARSDNPAKQKLIPEDTLLPDSLVIGVPLLVGMNLWLFEDAFVGVMEGANAIGWPSGQRKDVSMRTPERQPDATFTIQWRDGVDLGHTASIEVTQVRLLYKEIIP